MNCDILSEDYFLILYIQSSTGLQHVLIIKRPCSLEAFEGMNTKHLSLVQLHYQCQYSYLLFIVYLLSYYQCNTNKNNERYNPMWTK